ncbi:MAG: hypothetical protein KDA44_19755 [Planctomycetales bacterium]|nr:hypothetical protein [Planctomycetales bacterium]
MSSTTSLALMVAFMGLRLTGTKLKNRGIIGTTEVVGIINEDTILQGPDATN